MQSAEVVVVGAGIAGIAAAHELAGVRGMRDVVVVDPLPPLSLTSDKSTECYRNFWPDATMVAFMNRSIDRLEAWAEESGDRFAMNRNGYAYFTADRERARALERQAREVSALGAGELRVHRGAPGDPPFPEAPYDTLDRSITGADFLATPEAVRGRFPFLADDAVAALVTRRCGWLSAQQLGMWLWERAREAGARLVEGRAIAIETDGRGVSGVRIARGGTSERIETRRVVDAAGPHAAEVASLAGVGLPLANELHGKIVFEDVDRVVPRELPLVIWCDPIALAWSDEERAELARDPDLGWLLEALPGGVHFRPEGGPDGRMLLLLWTYHLESIGAPVFPARFDPTYPEVVLRGLSRAVPALARYLPLTRRPFVDGGYYCKTQENRLLVGPAAIEGFHLLCGCSGYGIMAAAAAADLLGAHIARAELPAYASEFLLSRYDDPSYRARLERGEFASGQL